MRPRSLIAIAALPLLAGCYTYSQTPLTSLTPGVQARVRLDEDGFGRVVNQAATNGVPVEMLDMRGRQLVGRVRQLGTSTLSVELRRPGGSVFAAEIPVPTIQDAAVRTFSPRRTIAAVGIGAAVASLVYAGATGGTTTPDGPPEPENLRVHFFSITLGR
jgi:hypothetical protein